MYFIAMLVQLEFTNRDRSLAPGDGEDAYSAILKTITREDREAGQALHDAKRHKRMSLAIVDNELQRTLLRLTFTGMDGLEHAIALTNALAARPRLQIRSATCRVKGVDLSNPDWCNISTWADLLSGPHGQYIEFAFTTPTAIAKRDGDNNRFFSLFPEPLDVFSGLAWRWRALRGPELPGNLERFIDKGGLVVRSHRLHTTSFETSERRQIGFVGSVTYTFLSDDVLYVAALNSLARLAAFTGVGYHTAQGMGAVKVKIQV